jgi:hypothetical protein
VSYDRQRNGDVQHVPSAAAKGANLSDTGRPTGVEYGHATTVVLDNFLAGFYILSRRRQSRKYREAETELVRDTYIQASAKSGEGLRMPS